jgi:heat shock protein HtpX
METGADAVRIPGWLRSRSRGAAWHAGDPSAPVADEVLIVRIADGDAGALAALYQRYGGKLFGFLRRYASDRMVAEEILQDTLLAVWRSVQLYAGRSSVRTWLFGVAWRQAHNRLRGRQPQEVPLDSLTGWVDPAPGPAELADFSAQGAAIADAFEALTLRHREVLALAFAAMMPHREIAEILGVPVGTVKSRLHHARAALARTLAERIIISAKMNTDDNSCPSCGSGLVTERDAAPWCPACEWNLALFEPKRHALFGWHRLDRAVDQFAHRVTRGQFKALAGRPVGRSGWDAAQIVTVSISLLLYAAVAAMAAGGVVLIASDFPSLTIVPGVALVLLAVALRPRFGRLDPDATTISPQQAPTLFRLIDSVAEAIGAPRPHTVVLDERFNAWAGAVGLRRRRVLGLGLPLWGVLPTQQRVALLGHELGHFVNGDIRRHMLVQPAYTTIGRLSELLRAGGGGQGADGTFMGLLTLVSHLIAVAVLGALRRIALCVQLVVTAVASRGVQRAEYLADEMAATVAGTKAAAEAQDTLLALSAMAIVVRSVARGRDGASAWQRAADEARTALAPRIPALRQLSIRDETSLFASHPPRGLRARMIESRPQQPPRIELAENDSARIDAELARYYERALRNLAWES